MALLITGGAGYIGSHAVLRAMDLGLDVVVADNFTTGFRAALPETVALAEGDLRDQGFIADLFLAYDIDAVMHFAAATSVPESIKHPLFYAENNTVASKQLIAAASRARVKAFVFSSTAAVYGDASVMPVHEGLQPAPLSPYGDSKLATEKDLAATSNVPYAALRYFNVAGADPQGRAGQRTSSATNLCQVVVDVLARKRDSLQIYGDDYDTHDGTGLRDYIHVTDLVDIHFDMLAHLKAGGKSDIYNCGYGRGYTVLDVITATERVSDQKVPFEIAPRRAGDIAISMADVSKLKATINWTPRHDSLDDMLAHMLQWQQRLAQE